MMRMMSNKKNVKIISLVIAFLFVLSVAALAYTQMAGHGSTSEATSIAVIDDNQMLSPNSELAVVLQPKVIEIQQKVEKEFEAKMKDPKLSDGDKQKLGMEEQMAMRQEFMKFQDEMNKKIDKAANDVAKGKGLSVVLHKGMVIYGGTDITPQVTSKLVKELQSEAPKSK